MKKQFFIATIVNILLWGCELLTLHAADLKKLEFCHHKGIRHILKKRYQNEASNRSLEE
jgi:hypothetical protein